MSTFGSAIDGVATNVTTETKTVQTGELEYMEFMYLVQQRQVFQSLKMVEQVEHQKLK